MNKQEMFNKVASHLMGQKKRAKSAKGNCKYRTTDGLMCAVGCLIPDEFYSKAIEGLGLQSPVLRNLMGKLHIEGLGLLFKLQLLHDSTPITRWKSSLKGLAKSSKLKVPSCLN